MVKYIKYFIFIIPLTSSAKRVTDYDSGPFNLSFLPGILSFKFPVNAVTSKGLIAIA